MSPTVQLELTYLHEIGRLTVGGGDILEDLGLASGSIDQTFRSMHSSTRLRPSHGRETRSTD